MVMFGLIIALAILCAFVVTAPPVTQTTCGPVAGLYQDGAYSFRGIPYAEPPIGPLRWKQPRLLSKTSGTCWNGTLMAQKYGNTCYQRSPYDPTKYDGSEDCLYLNVFTPTFDVTARKPVMVWLHGCSLQCSSGDWPLYSPTEKLAKDTDIVFVGLNYRLHAFGFLALQILADDSSTKTSGNYGFMDMLAVLQWIQMNIENFGGDPKQVTLFGQSSGATAIFGLLTSPLSKGLFHKAWLLSGSPVLNKTATDAFKDNEIFMQRSGCSDLTCLYALSSAEVTTAVPWDVYPYWAMKDQGDLPTKGLYDGAIAIVDGYVIPEPPFVAWSRGRMIDVPLLIGTCANEIDFEPTYMDLNNWTWTQYDEHVQKSIGTYGNLIYKTAMNLYPSGFISPEYQFSSMASDIRANCPNDIMAMYAASTFKSQVYRYVVTSWPSKPINAVGIPFSASYSMHMWDVFAFFGFIKYYIKNPTAADLQWQQNVRDEVLSFIHFGFPKSDIWLPYPGVTANFSSVTTPVAAFHPVQCEFWLNTGFFSYAWIN